MGRSEAVSPSMHRHRHTHPDFEHFLSKHGSFEVKLDSFLIKATSVFEVKVESFREGLNIFSKRNLV